MFSRLLELYYAFSLASVEKFCADRLRFLDEGLSAAELFGVPVGGLKKALPLLPPFFFADDV
jgi:hypothetical protein